MKAVLNRILSVFSYFFTESFLQESDLFVNALIASTKKEPCKRKRRTSSSKDGPEAKKGAVTGKEKDTNKESTPPTYPTNNNEDNRSPPIVKPLPKVSSMTHGLRKCDSIRYFECSEVKLAGDNSLFI
jgi:hypothetical protein